MKRFIFCLIAMLTIFTAVSARNFEVCEQSDVGLHMPTSEKSIDLLSYAVVPYEAVTVVQAMAIKSPNLVQKTITLHAPNPYCNPEYGLCSNDVWIRPVKIKGIKNTKQIPK